MLWYICTGSIEPTGFAKRTELSDCLEICYQSEWAYELWSVMFGIQNLKSIWQVWPFECTLRSSI